MSLDNENPMYASQFYSYFRSLFNNIISVLFAKTLNSHNFIFAFKINFRCSTVVYIEIFNIQTNIV